VTVSSTAPRNFFLPQKPQEATGIKYDGGFLLGDGVEQSGLAFQIKSGEISDEMISRCKDLRSAIRLCIEVSGKQIKEVASDIGINKDHLSRMINTSDDPRHFPPERLNDLMTICRNEIPLRWQALSRGYGLYRLKSELEMELERTRSELEEARKEQALMMKLVKEIRG